MMRWCYHIYRSEKEILLVCTQHFICCIDMWNTIAKLFHLLPHQHFIYFYPMVSSTDERQPVRQELQNSDFITLSFLPLLLYGILCKEGCPSLSRATLTRKYSSFMKSRVCLFFLNSFLELPILNVRSLWPTCINWWERVVLFPLLEVEISPLPLLSSCGWTLTGEKDKF